MKKGSISIHSENILPIIKRWLYSDKDIFIRELVSNACDAIQKLKILRDRSETDCNDSEFRVDIKIDKEKKTLKFIDTGIGMDFDEVEKYITNIAFSGAEEFLQKYQSDNENDHMIGHFGLGFYSAYMVADLVEIQTQSYKETAGAVSWSSEGSTEYEIGDGTKTERGTEITLHINDENKEFLEVHRIREILNRYCSFLPFPIYLNDSHINSEEPLWLKPASELKDEDYINFYSYLYPLEPKPLFWVHLNVDYPFHLKGILYFPKIRKDFDFNKNTIKLFYNRVFVTDDCRDLIPDYLMMLKGAIDSPDIPINVSRSSLQVDKTIRKLSSHISKKVADRLLSYYRADKNKFIECYQDIEVILKLGLMQDDKFYDRLKECLIWKSINNEWITIEDYIDRNKDKAKEKIFYCTSLEKDSEFVKMYQDQGIEVLIADGPVDTHVMSFLESKLIPNKFLRIDSNLDDAILDSSKEKSLLDSEGKTEASKLADLIKNLLDKDNVDVEAKSLKSQSLPALLVIDEEMRRLKDYMRMTQQDSIQALDNKIKFVVNTNSPLINNLQKLHQKNSVLAKEVLRQLFDLTRLSQKEMDAKELQNYATNSFSLLEKLSNEAIGL